MFACGCATTHPGNLAQTSNTPSLKVSSKISGDLSDDYYLFIEYTIENLSGQWATINVTDLDISGRRYEGLAGSNLKAWTEGAELKLRQAQYNTNAFLTGLTVASAGTALFSKSSKLKKAGLTGMAAGGAGSVGVSVSRSKKQANSGLYSPSEISKDEKVVPDGHIFSSFKVAPGSFVRKWIVIKNPPLRKFDLNTFISVNDFNADKFTTKH